MFGQIGPLYRALAHACHLSPRQVDDLELWECAALLGLDEPDPTDDGFTPAGIDDARPTDPGLINRLAALGG